MANETGIADVVDPLGGSWYVEGLTTKLYNESKKLIEEIDSCGGALTAIENGFQQRHLHESAWAEQVAQDKGDLLVIGVNHALESQTMSDLKGQSVDPSLGEAQCNLLSNIRANRNSDNVSAALANVHNIAQNGGNTMQAILDAVKAECTIGEIMNALKESFGTWMAPSGV